MAHVQLIIHKSTSIYTIHRSLECVVNHTQATIHLNELAHCCSGKKRLAKGQFTQVLIGSLACG